MILRMPPSQDRLPGTVFGGHAILSEFAEQSLAMNAEDLRRTTEITIVRIQDPENVSRSRSSSVAHPWAWATVCWVTCCTTAGRSSGYITEWGLKVTARSMAC